MVHINEANANKLQIDQTNLNVKHPHKDKSMFYGTYSTRGGSFPQDRSRQREDNSDECKDPWEVLGLQKNATKEQIRAAYRKLALKYHPDRVSGEGAAGAEAKREATAKFTEISAAYELLLDDNTRGSSGASHPSFSTAPNHRTMNDYSRYDASTTVQSPFSPGFDPFGFGPQAFGFHFSDPFELFQRAFNQPYMEDSPFEAGIPSMSSFFAQMPSFPANAVSSSSSYSSSSFFQGNGGNGVTKKMVSTTQSSVNGKIVTRHEEVITHPDGKITRTVKISGGDEIAQEQRPAITADVVEDDDEREERDLAKAIALSLSESADSNGSCGDRKQERHYRVETKQHLEEQTSGARPRKLDPLVIPKDEVYVIDDDLTNERPRQVSLEIPAHRHKRKFCDIMSRCLKCCFPRPKRRKISHSNGVVNVGIHQRNAENKSDVDYSSLTVAQLRDILRRRGLKVSGKKADLISRLASA